MGLIGDDRKVALLEGGVFLDDLQDEGEGLNGDDDDRLAFDQGLGDLFVVRVAGNIADSNALGSLEYGAQVLGARFLMVLGHEYCGAVDAALKGGHAGGNIDSVLDAIAPAAGRAKADPAKTDLLDRAVVENVREVLMAISKRSPALAGMAAKGELKIVGARYDLDSGAVTPVTAGK